jgi:dihydroflavonol-4-reductase
VTARASTTADSPAATAALDGPLDPVPSEWPVLVTGAGGFVGGHIARLLASAGHRVRGLTRRTPASDRSAPGIEWITGDICDAEVRRRAVAGMRGVIHSAGWVSLGADRDNVSFAVNVESTARLLEEAAAAGAERFVYTSTLYALAAGTEQKPADESSPWNLSQVDSAYTRTKRLAEKIVLGANRPGFTTIAICPGMVQGPGDFKPTSTRIAKAFSRALLAIVPPGGIPIIDVEVLAVAHRRALVHGEPGVRYAVVGPYLSYGDLAALVAQVAGRPRWLMPLPEWSKPVVVTAARFWAPFVRRWWPDVSAALAEGGYLRLHISGDRANARFGLEHPQALESIERSL